MFYFFSRNLNINSKPGKMAVNDSGGRIPHPLSNGHTSQNPRIVKKKYDELQNRTGQYLNSSGWKSDTMIRTVLSV